MSYFGDFILVCNCCSKTKYSDQFIFPKFSDADILAAAIERLRKRIAAGTANFLVKVKAHREEPANEGADILADKAISDPKAGKE